MAQFNKDFTKVDVSLLQQLINKCLEIYASINATNVSKISYYARSDIATGARIFYYYLVRNCRNDEEKLNFFQIINLDSIAQQIVKVCVSSLDLRNKIINKGIRMFSELSYTIESTLVFYIDIVKPYSRTNYQETLMADLFLKFFNQALGLLRMLNLNLSSEAYSNWRTLHEAECVIKLLVEGGKPLQDVYIRHIIYNNAFRKGIPSKEETDRIFVEIKSNMAKHNLKSKDMKKYIEYGWLYACDQYHEENPDYKLNFRNGLQQCASLSKYNQFYEMASEMAHSSPIFFYSNDAFFSDLTSVNLTDIALRGVGYFDEYMKSLNLNYGDKQDVHDVLIYNLNEQAKIEDDSFYTKYKDYIVESEDDEIQVN